MATVPMHVVRVGTRCQIIRVSCHTDSRLAAAGGYSQHAYQTAVVGTGTVVACTGAWLSERGGWDVQDAKELKEKVKLMYQKHITSPVETGPVEEGVHKEYHRQRDYLEKTVQSLKNKLDKDMLLHRTDNLRAVQENVALIKEINELRRETKSLKAAAARQTGVSAKATDAKELEMQRGLISELRRDIATKEARIAQLEAQILPRPMSREQLPPMEGFRGPA